MRHAAAVDELEDATTDRAALLLMLSYVEAECIRLGATEAAKHAALAATLMPRPGSNPAGKARPGRSRLH